MDIFRPMIWRDADTGGADGGAGGGQAAGAAEGKGNEEQSRTFKQSELDALFAARAKQARESALTEMLKDLGAENLDGLKATLKAADEARKAQMSDLEKAQQATAELKAKLEAEQKARESALAQAQEKLLRAAVLAEAGKQGFNDPNDAWLYIERASIKAKEDDSFEGIDKVVEAVAKAKPYLVKSNAGSNQGTPGRAQTGPGRKVGKDLPQQEGRRKSLVSW